MISSSGRTGRARARKIHAAAQTTDEPIDAHMPSDPHTPTEAAHRSAVGTLDHRGISVSSLRQEGISTKPKTAPVNAKK